MKTRNDLMGEITPMVFSDLGAPQNPHGPFIPAPWLPLEWQDAESKDWFVMSTGKVVCLTTVEGWVVPAGLKGTWTDAAGGDTILTYTSDDYDMKVMDLTTGEAYVVDGTTNYTKTQVQTALRSRGLVGPAATPQTYLSAPVGCVFGDVYAWAGGSGWNPAHLNFQNYQKQKGVQFTSFAQMILPVVPASHSSASVPGALTGSALTFGSGNIYSGANAILAERYEEVTNANVIAWSLADYPMASDTDRTPLVGSSTDFLVTEKKVDLATYPTNRAAVGAVIDRLTSAGDYFVDYEVGVIFMYASGGASIPANVSGESITYYWYGAAPSTVQRYVCAVGDLKPGDWLMVDDNSNFQEWDGTNAEDRIARVVSVVTEPRNLLEYVRTAWANTTGMGAQQQMSGSASKGFSSAITYSDASDKLVRVVLNVR